MILAAAVCPHPPLLFRELNGRQDAVADLRATCREAVRDVVAGAERAVLVGGAETSRSWDPTLPPPVHRYGGSRFAAPGRGETLPLSLGVGRRLLDEAGWDGPVEVLSIAWDAPRADAEVLAGDLAGRAQRLAVLTLGDGSARRGPTAPAPLAARAVGYDDATAHALAEGDAQALLELDPQLAADLGVSGRAAFGVLGALALAHPGGPAAVVATLRHRDDPIGVSYFVATWSFR